MGNKIKFLPTEREQENYSTSLLQHLTLIDIWNICCCRVVFVWQQFMIVSGIGKKLDIGNGHWRIIWTYTYIFIGDIAQVSHKRVLFLKPNIIVTVLEGRYCSSVTNVKYGWVPEVRDSYRCTSEVNQYCSRVPDTRYCSRISDIRYCSRLVDVKHWTKILNTWPTTTTTALSVAKRCSQ